MPDARLVHTLNITCGDLLCTDSRLCKSCGAKIPEVQPGRYPKFGAAPTTSSDIKNQILAAVLSLIIPRLSQSYNGNTLKEKGRFLGIAIFWIISLLMYSEVPFIRVFVLLSVGVFNAYRDTWWMNRGQAGLFLCCLSAGINRSSGSVGLFYATQ